jgi:hypothetical protein
MQDADGCFALDNNVPHFDRARCSEFWRNGPGF